MKTSLIILLLLSGCSGFAVNLEGNLVYGEGVSFNKKQDLQMGVAPATPPAPTFPDPLVEEPINLVPSNSDYGTSDTVWPEKKIIQLRNNR